LKFAQKKEDTSLTTENIIEMMKKNGITDIEAKDEGIIFRLEGSLYTLDYKFQPIIRFGSVSVMEDDIDRDIAKKVAEEFNKEFFNANVEVDDGGAYFITCMTFADNLKDLFNGSSFDEAIPGNQRNFPVTSKRIAEMPSPTKSIKTFSRH
jgi:hypothetical protein